jgi:ABC-type glutathione transport system ATPase component
MPDLSRDGGRKLDLVGFSLQRFRAGWGPRCVIEALDLTLESGELLMIVGPGGSGKSTLLAALDGLINNGPLLSTSRLSAGPWWEGELEVGFRRAARAVQHGRHDPERVRVLFEALGVEPGPSAWCWPSEPELARELDAALDRPLAELPDGLRRLASFLLTASTGAELLLLDEPDFGQRGAWLDHVHAVIAKLRAEQRSIVAVTHYLPLARSMGDRVGLMVDGRMIEIAPTRDFFERPQQPRTQQFIQWGA